MSHDVTWVLFNLFWTWALSVHVVPKGLEHKYRDEPFPDDLAGLLPTIQLIKLVLAGSAFFLDEDLDGPLGFMTMIGGPPTPCRS